MDNGRPQKMQKISAKELTAEIDRATDLGLAAGAESQGFSVQEQMERPGSSMAREQAQQLGWQVMEGGNNRDSGVAGNVGDARNAAEIVDFAATQEIMRDQAELTQPKEFVGDETELQIGERLEAQQENSLNDINPKRDFEAEIVARSQEKIAQETMKRVDRMVNKNFSPLEMERVYREMGDRTLESFENPHPIGKGN